MKKKSILIAIIAILLSAGGCKDDDFLNVPPNSILTPEQAFSEPSQVLAILADLYNRQEDFSTIDNRNNWQGTDIDPWTTFSDFGESFPSDNGLRRIVQDNTWGLATWAIWDYNYIRDLNLFMERLAAAPAITAEDKTRFAAEARFLRANYYFEMVKRMGGVPLITKSLVYEGDATSLQYPRAKESDIYDFVIAEADSIKTSLPKFGDKDASKSRATMGAALAMQTRAALYAGSIAKYGVNTPSVTLPGKEVGIPSNMASKYYETALKAAKEIINGSAGSYTLYQKNPGNLADNFAAIFYDKGVNPETIFIEDFKIKAGKTHGFTINNQPRFGAEEAEGGRINPSLNLVEAFEKLDNTYAPLATNDASGNPIYYANQLDIFADRDARLAGTVTLPGSYGRNRTVDIWAGYQLANGSIVTSGDLGGTGEIGGQKIQVVGGDGPIEGVSYAAQTGFYLRKYIDPAVGGGSRGTGSDVPFVRYRYAEVLLNAAEAAFELGQTADAVNYINQVRSRAGLIIPLTAADLTFDRIVHERRVELAFEGHILFDMKRWRIAHIVWDGRKMTPADLLTNIGKATKRNTQPYSLLPYKYYNPSIPNNDKWLYKVSLNSLVTGARDFQLGNYYSTISNDIITRNPKIVKQPNQ